MIKTGFILGPTEDDGRLTVQLSACAEGWQEFSSGAGDNLSPVPPATGRGEGARIRQIFAGPATASVDLEYIEPVKIVGGTLWCTPIGNWTGADVWHLDGIMPATTPTVNASTLGNCNLVPMGGYNLIVPAPGNGAHDVDLAVAVPVPSSMGNTGYWDCDDVTGIVTASADPGGAGFHLLDVPAAGKFMHAMPFGSPTGISEKRTYKSKWISERWKVRCTVTKASAGAGETDGYLDYFRSSVA